eukprot:1497517-Amphidinium_carterae.1
MNRVRSLGLPAPTKAKIAKSLYSVGLYGAEVGGMSTSHMNDVRRERGDWIGSWPPLGSSLLASG